MAYIAAVGSAVGHTTAKAAKSAPQAWPWSADQLSALLGQPWASGTTQPDLAELAAGDKAQQLAQRCKLYALQVRVCLCSP